MAHLALSTRLAFAAVFLAVLFASSPSAQAQEPVTDIDGHLVPQSEFIFVDEPSSHCGFPHHHAADPDGVVVALDGFTFIDPEISDGNPCGFGWLQFFIPGENGTLFEGFFGSLGEQLGQTALPDISGSLDGPSGRARDGTDLPRSGLPVPRSPLAEGLGVRPPPTVDEMLKILDETTRSRQELARTAPPFGCSFDGAGADRPAVTIPLEGGGFLSAGTTGSFFDGSQNGLLLWLDAFGAPWRTLLIGDDAPHPDKPVHLTTVLTKPDGGVVAGAHTSLPVSPNFGPDDTADLLVVNLGPDGRPVWERRYGGVGHEEMVDLHLLPDGGFIVGATSSSFGDGDKDVFLLQLDKDGGIVHALRIGDAGDETLAALRATKDGGYVLAATTTSFPGTGADILVIRLDARMAAVWQKRIATPTDDTAADIHPTADGGFLLAGSVSSPQGDPGQGLLVRLDGRGEIVWQKGLDHDGTAESLVTAQERSDAVILAAGHTSPGRGGEADVANVLLLTLTADGGPLHELRIGSAGMDDRVTDVRIAEGDRMLISGYERDPRPGHNKWHSCYAADQPWSNFTFVSVTNVGTAAETVTVNFHSETGAEIASTSSCVAPGATWHLGTVESGSPAVNFEGHLTVGGASDESDLRPWAAVIFRNSIPGFTTTWINK